MVWRLARTTDLSPGGHVLPGLYLCAQRRVTLHRCPPPAAPGFVVNHVAGEGLYSLTTMLTTSTSTELPKKPSNRSTDDNGFEVSSGAPLLITPVRSNYSIYCPVKSVSLPARAGSKMMTSDTSVSGRIVEHSIVKQHASWVPERYWPAHTAAMTQSDREHYDNAAIGWVAIDPRQQLGTVVGYTSPAGH